MRNKFTLNVFLLILMFCSFDGFVSAQGFKGIVPLESTCEDVKRILQVEECIVPRSIYWLQDFRVSISFTQEKPSEGDKLCYKVPAGRVLSLTVSYNKPFPIKEFEYELKYTEGPFGDIDTISYENEEKGVSVLTNLGRINTAIFAPTPEQHKKYAYECKSTCKQENNNE